MRYYGSQEWRDWVMHYALHTLLTNPVRPSFMVQMEGWIWVRKLREHGFTEDAQILGDWIYAYKERKIREAKAEKA